MDQYRGTEYKGHVAQMRHTNEAQLRLELLQQLIQLHELLCVSDLKLPQDGENREVVSADFGTKYSETQCSVPKGREAFMLDSSKIF